MNINLINILTGNKFKVATFPNFPGRFWFKSGLRKGGQPDLRARYHYIGVKQVNNPREGEPVHSWNFTGEYAVVDSARDAAAEPLRAEVARLQAELEIAHVKLLNHYAS